MMLFTGGVTTAETTPQVTVVSNTCYVYEDASFDSPIYDGDEKVTFTHGEKLDVLSDENGDFIKIKFSIGEQTQSGYVYRYYVTYSTLSQEQYPVFNAKVIHDEAIIYKSDKTPSGHTAKAGQGIYLYKGYSSGEWNAVEIVLEDGSLYYGYMKTADISTNGISAGLITGIMLIATCLTIIFLLVFMKKKKKRQ